MYKKLLLEIGATQRGMCAMHFDPHKSHRLVCQSTDVISHGYLHNKQDIKVASN